MMGGCGGGGTKRKSGQGSEGGIVRCCHGQLRLCCVMFLASVSSFGFKPTPGSFFDLRRLTTACTETKTETMYLFREI
jgi:hypothetical protein